MQRLEVSCAVRPKYGSLGVKRLRIFVMLLIQRQGEFQLYLLYLAPGLCYSICVCVDCTLL